MWGETIVSTLWRCTARCVVFGSRASLTARYPPPPSPPSLDDAKVCSACVFVRFSSQTSRRLYLWRPPIYSLSSRTNGSLQSWCATWSYTALTTTSDTRYPRRHLAGSVRYRRPTSGRWTPLAKSGTPHTASSKLGISVCRRRKPGTLSLTLGRLVPLTLAHLSGI